MLRSLEIMERVSPEDDFDLGGLINNIAQVEFNLGKIDEAIKHYLRALDTKLKGYKNFENPEKQTVLDISEKTEIAASIAMSYANIVEAYKEKSDEKNAEEYINKGYEHVKKGCPAETITLFAETLIKCGKYETATEMLEFAEEELTKALNTPKDLTAVLDPGLMTFELYKEDFKKTGRVPKDLILTKINKARMQQKLGNQFSINNLPELSDVTERIYGPGSPEVAEEHQKIGVALHFLAQETKKPEIFAKAEKYYTNSLTMIKDKIPEDHPFFQMCISNLQELFSDTGRNPDSIKY